MKKLQIKKNGIVTHEIIVSTELEKNKWISKNKDVFPKDYDLEETDATAEVQKQQELVNEDTVDYLCKKAYRLIKLYNRKNFENADVQTVIGHPDYIKWFCCIIGGNPGLTKQIQQGIAGFTKYPPELMSEYEEILQQAIDLSK